MEGFEQINTQTMAIPFLRILQQGSPQVKKQDPAYVEGAEEGLFFNTVTKNVYGDTIKVIVLKFERIFIEWRPNRGGFAGYHSPENAERLAVKKEFGNWKLENGNHLSEAYVYMCLIAGHETEGIAILSLSSSMIKAAREWNNLLVRQTMNDGRRAAPYWLVWEVKTEYRSNDKGSWYIPRILLSPEKFVNEQQYALVMPERKALPSRQVDYSQLTADAPADNIDKDAQF